MIYCYTPNHSHTECLKTVTILFAPALWVRNPARAPLDGSSPPRMLAEAMHLAVFDGGLEGQEDFSHTAGIPTFCHVACPPP